MKLLRRIKDWFWFKFLIKEDEFHGSLDLDFKKLVGKSDKEKNKYMADLIMRRQKAHEMDITKTYERRRKKCH